MKYRALSFEKGEKKTPNILIIQPKKRERAILTADNDSSHNSKQKNI